MKMNNKKNISAIFSILLSSFICLSFISCEFFSNEIPENKCDNSQLINSADSGKLKLVFTPLSNDGGARSAFPDFSSLSDFTFWITSENLTETQGTYESNKIIFEIPNRTIEDENFTIFAKKSNDICLFAKTKISYEPGGTSLVASSINLNPYRIVDGNTIEPPKGHVALKVTVTSGYTLSTVIEGDTENKINVTGNGGNSNTIRTDNTDAGKVSCGSYLARISVSKDGQLVDCILQTINVWPGMTTNCWYLNGQAPDQDKQEYHIDINTDEIKYYVKGSSPKGIYGSQSLPSLQSVSASNSNDGSIMAPLQTIQAALDKCTSSTAKYKIICDGNFGGFTFGNSDNSEYKSSNITIAGRGNSDYNPTITGTVKIATKANFTLENITILSVSQSSNNGINFNTSGSISDGRTLTLDNCIINGWSKSINTASDGNNSKLIIKGSTSIPPQVNGSNYIYLDNCEIYIDGPLDTSGDTSGLRTVASIQAASESVSTQYIFAENGANLTLESKRFKYMSFPKFINTEGKLAISKDFYVSASAASGGDGSPEKPLQTVSSAIGIINSVQPSQGGDYKVHISGTIIESDTINLVGSTGGTLSNFYAYNSTSPATLTLCGTDNTTDILDGSGGTGPHSVLSIKGNTSYKLKVTIENLTIQNGTAVCGGGINVSYGVLKIGNGCKITKNESTSDSYGGGAVYVEDSDLFVYGDAIIGYNASQAVNDSDTAKENGGNIARAFSGGAIYTLGTSTANPSTCNVWIGYTAENVPDSSGKTCKISGNFAKRSGGAIYIDPKTSFYMCKGSISYNYAIDCGGGLYFTFRQLEHFYRNISGGNITGNQAASGTLQTQGGGGIFIGENSSGGYLHLSGNTVIEGNEVVADNAKGGAIYGASEMEIEGNVYIPFEAVKKNDVYMPSGKKIKILDTLSPPDEANGITATITPETYDSTTVLLQDNNSGAKVNANYDKFKVTPNGTSQWKIKSDGSIYVPFNVTVNNTTYTSKDDFIAAVTDSSLDGKKIKINILEVNIDDLGPSNITSGTNVLKAIKSTTADQIILRIDESANVKLPADSKYFFSGLQKVSEMYLDGVDTSDVESMQNMFDNCITNCYSGVLDIRNFDTSKVTNMKSMFSMAGAIKTIIVGPNFTTEHVNSSNDIFFHASKLVGGAGTKFTDGDGTIAYAVVDGGPESATPGYFTSVSQLPPELTPDNIDDIFANLQSGINKIVVKGDITQYNSNIATKLKALNGTDKLVELDFTRLENTVVKPAPDFSDCENLIKFTCRCGDGEGCLYLSQKIFNNCSGLKTVKIIDRMNSSTAVEDIKWAFEGCEAIEELDLTECKEIYINGAYLSNQFQGDNRGYNTSLKKIIVSQYSIDNITIRDSVRFINTDFMFYYPSNPVNTWISRYPTMEGSQREPLQVQFSNGIQQYDPTHGDWRNP